MTLRRIIISLAVIGLSLAACSTSSTAEAGFSETPSAVLISSGTGNVSVTAGEAGATVSAEIDASGEDPPWRAELVGTELLVDDGCGDRTDCEVNLIIEVDGTADVIIESAAGAVTVVDMNSSISIAGAASNVLLNGLTGPITVDLTSGDLLGARLVSTVASFATGSGDLDVTLTEAFESLTVTSGDGNVTAQVPDGGYDIDATTADGDIELDVDDVDGAASAITISTDKGDVTVYRR